MALMNFMGLPTGLVKENTQTSASTSQTPPPDRQENPKLNSNDQQPVEGVKPVGGLLANDVGEKISTQGETRMLPLLEGIELKNQLSSVGALRERYKAQDEAGEIMREYFPFLPPLKKD